MREWEASRVAVSTCDENKQRGVGEQDAEIKM